MKLLTIKLKNYTRLYVTGITYLEYSPDKPMQILLASNGSGKSSLLKEIIPNVEDKINDYDTDGYMSATYEHNNKMYTIGYIRNTNKHSFKINDKDLNGGGLKKIQKMLIEEHFGLIKNINELLLSTTTFTTMSTSERKKWFTEIISTVDYTYALSVYNKCKVKIRDLTSYIKLTQSKMLHDESIFKSIKQDDLKHLEYDRTMYQQLIDECLNLKINHLGLDKPDINTLMVLTSKLGNLITKVGKYNLTYKDTNKLIHDIESDIKYRNEELHLIDKKLKDLDSFKVDDSYNSTTLEARLKEVQSVVGNFKFLEVDNINMLNNLVTIFNNNYDNLQTLIDELYEYKDITGTASVLNKLKNDTERISLKMSSLTLDIKHLDKEVNILRHHEEQDDVTCPKCSNIFKPNYDVVRLKQLSTKLGSLNNDFKVLETEYKLKHEHYIKLANKLIIEDKIVLILNNVPPVYKYLKPRLSDISNLSNIINNFYMSLPDVKILDSLEREYKELTNKLELIKSLSINKIETIKKDKDSLLTERIAKITDINNLTTKLHRYKRLLLAFNTIDIYRKKIDVLLRDRQTYKCELLQDNYNTYLNNIIRLAKDEIYTIEEKLTTYNNVKEHYETLQSELETYKTELEVNKKIEEYLSPSKGLIGSTITNTINIVLDKMNFIINKVWEHEINILPCDVSENDLTFRFPVMINNIKSIPDVLKGSSSMREIIDLAFKISVMELLDMLEYPLILDEFSSTMDSTHRINSYNYIEKLSKEYFSQIFLVSHYAEIFLRFANNTDVNVLNNDNVNYDGTFNEVMIIK